MSYDQMYQLSTFSLDYARARQQELLRQARAESLLRPAAQAAQGPAFRRFQFRAAYALRRIIYRFAPDYAFRIAL